MALADVDFEAVKKGIREAEGGEKRKELERVLEVIGKLEALGTVDATVIKSEQDRLSSLVRDRDRLLASTRGDLFKRLYEAANSVIGSGEWAEESKCPLCLSSLQTSIKAHIQGQLEQYRGVADKDAEIKVSCQSAHWISRLALLEKAEPLSVDERDRVAAGLSRSAANGLLAREDLEGAIKRLLALEELPPQKLRELNTTKEQLERDLPASLVLLTEQVEYGRQFRDGVRLYRQKQKEESALRSQLEIRERWRRFITRASTVFSEAEGSLSKEKIRAIDSEYKTMFKKIMNVGDVVPDLQRADEREDLHLQLIDFHGQHSVSARALLSESYRNALAICVFLAAALKHSSAPRFVVLDDVTSSFDAGHQFFLMELIRQELQHPRHTQGLQFIILSHDGLLEKYFDRQDSTASWNHQRLRGAPPMGAVLSQAQDAGRLKTTIETLLNAGEVPQAEHLIRQYLEYKLQQIIRKVDVPVPIDFAMKDQSRMVSNCLDAINAAVNLHKQAGTVVLDSRQIQDLDKVHVPALVGNWISHYETGMASGLSAPVLRGIVKTVDELAECFRYDDNSSGTVVRRWYKSLSSRS